MRFRPLYQEKRISFERKRGSRAGLLENRVERNISLDEGFRGLHVPVISTEYFSAREADSHKRLEWVVRRRALAILRYFEVKVLPGPIGYRLGY
jgi:hypothetical protein